MSKCYGTSDTTWFTRHLQKPKVYVPTGFSNLDRLIDGLYPGTLTVVGARPGVGKTTTVLNMIANVPDRKHLIFTTEVSKERFLEKFASLVSGTPDKLIRQNSHNMNGSVPDIMKCVEKYSLFIDDTYNPTIELVISRIEEVQPDVLYFDYFQNISIPTTRYTYQEYTAKVKELHALAIKYKLPIVLCSQLKRPGEDRKDSRPRLSDLKETGKLEEAAKTVILLWNDGQNLVMCVDKNRDGATGELRYEGRWETNKLVETV